MTVYDQLKAIFGTHDAVAAAFGIKRQALDFWRKNGIPPSRALEVERVTNGKIKALDVLRG